jgi:DNA polymerase (family 10)
MIPTNQQIARRLREQAWELARSRANLYRVRAFRRAAMAVLALPVEVATLVARGGESALERVPGVGRSLARTLVGYLEEAAVTVGGGPSAACGNAARGNATCGHAACGNTTCGNTYRHDVPGTAVSAP